MHVLNRFHCSSSSCRILRPRVPTYHTLWHAYATQACKYPFPRHAKPTPWEIFHFSLDDKLTPALVKKRYYELVQLYHPDRVDPADKDDKSRRNDCFKQIVAAYAILKDPGKRAAYAQFGGDYDSPSHCAQRSDMRRKAERYWKEHEAARARERRMPDGYYYFRTTQFYDRADPSSARFRPGYVPSWVYEQQRQNTGLGNATVAQGWNGKGALGTNGTVVLAVAAVFFALTNLSVWSNIPSDVQASLVYHATGEYHGTRPETAQLLHRARQEAHFNKLERIRCLKQNAKLISESEARSHSARSDNAGGSASNVTDDAAQSEVSRESGAL